MEYCGLVSEVLGICVVDGVVGQAVPMQGTVGGVKTVVELVSADDSVVGFLLAIMRSKYVFTLSVNFLKQVSQ